MVKNRIFAILTCLALSAAAEAEPLAGIRFDIMPVGCKIHAQYQPGKVWVERYDGKKGQVHQMTIYADKSANSEQLYFGTMYYDADGFLVKRSWSTGLTEIFEPYSCATQLGTCKNSLRNSEGFEADFVGKVIRKGKGYILSGQYAGGPPQKDRFFKLGPFNYMTQYGEGAAAYKVVKFEDCGEEPAS